MRKQMRYGILGMAAFGVVAWAVLPSKSGAAAPTVRSTAHAALLTYEVPSGTDGGPNTGGAWTQRGLNRVVYDPMHLVMLAGNQFTLKPGTYLVEAQQTIFGDISITKGFRGRIRNITDGYTAGVSLSVRIHEESGESATLVSPVPPTLVEIDRPTTFELQYFCEAADGNSRALGLNLPTGEAERYASVFIQKVD